MNRTILALSLLVAFASAAPAAAIGPFLDAFKAKYVVKGAPLAAKVEVTKCNVCHVGKSKKDRNEYGLTVGKFLHKVDFTGKAKVFDPKTDMGKKALDEGLTKAGDEKASDGVTFDERIAAGKLPVE